MNESTRDPLDAQRTAAAKATRGISGDLIYQAVLKAADVHGVSGRVMDYGAGTGTVAKMLASRPEVTRVDAVDLVDYTGGERSPKVEWVFSDLNEPLPIDSGTYDLITAVEVIEHLENPRFLAREWFRLLRPGGSLVVSTPNNECWRALVSLQFRGHFYAFTGASYPVHITALLRLDFERILTEAGFQDIRFSFTDQGSIPGLTRFTWQQVSFGALKGLRFSDCLICSARKPAA